ncbi:hypothetical protein [Dyella choica]|uniref:Uncharacterized protein n=1 Tax=Dyella choica TaxID=1927959 RepID=A0A432M5R0_9GAMM|nr:hypothetical protein [Dyella choica]RUL75408.1 hypothetical protein EKH80_11865 [Dyella choica]
MKWLLPIPLMLSCAGCVKHLQEPPAAVSFVRFEKTSYTYKLTFNSKAGFLAASYTDKLPVVGHWLICSLDGDTDFSIDHAFSLRRFMRGITDSADHVGKGQQSLFAYSSELTFSETLDGGTSDHALSKTDVNSLLAGRSSIPCKVIMTITGYAPYYSMTMQVPAKVLLDEVNR